MSLLAIGGQLLGGIFGNRAAKKAAAQQRAWALEDQAMQWVRHREASEAGGFNPLATLGLSQGVAPTPASSNNYMGEAIASSALILADNYAKTRQAAMGRQVEDLRRQRDILTRKLTQNTIRPKVAGVYGIGGQNGKGANQPVPFVSPVEMGIDRSGDPVTPEEKHTFTTLHSSGASSNVPSPGVDPDEAAFGWLIDQNNRRKAENRFENTWPAIAGRAQRFRPRPSAENNWNDSRSAASNWFWDTLQW